VSTCKPVRLFCLVKAMPQLKYLSELRQLLPSQPSRLETMETTTIAGCVAVLDALVKALACGQVNPSTAQTLISAVSTQARLLEAHELERRVHTLETQLEALREAAGETDS